MSLISLGSFNEPSVLKVRSKSEEGQDDIWDSDDPGGNVTACSGNAGTLRQHRECCCPQIQVTRIWKELLKPIFLFRKVDLTASFCQLLTMLAVFDSILVVSAVISFSLPLLSQHWNLVRIANVKMPDNIQYIQKWTVLLSKFIQFSESDRYWPLVGDPNVNIFYLSTSPPSSSPTSCQWSRYRSVAPSGPSWPWPGRGSSPSPLLTGQTIIQLSGWNLLRKIFLSIHCFGDLKGIFVILIKYQDIYKYLCHPIRFNNISVTQLS